MTTPEARATRWRTTANVVWAVIGMLILIGVSGWVIGRVAGALAPFAIAFLLVFFLQGLVNALERRGFGRALAVVTCFAAGFVTLSIAAVFLFPPVSGQLVQLANAVPDYVRSGEDLLTSLQARFSTVVVPEWLRAIVLSIGSAFTQVVVRLGNSVAQGIVSAGSGLATIVFDLFLGLVIAFWTLKDLPKIRMELRTLAGDKYEADLENLMSTVIRVVGGYLRGQTIASIVTGLIAGIGLALIGVPYALVLGIVTLAFNYVPYVGPFLAGLIAAVVGAFVSPLTALLAVVIVIAAQQLTDLFVTPRVMSEQVDLHPTLVIFSLLIGGTLLGFWGLIFAIPIAATGKGLFVYYYERKTNRSLATEDGALFRASQCDETSPEPCEEGAERADTGEAPTDATVKRSKQ